jgi:hypothetical protein
MFVRLMALVLFSASQLRGITVNSAMKGPKVRARAAWMSLEELDVDREIHLFRLSL